MSLRGVTVQPRPARPGKWRPSLGLILPVAAALLWEAAVRAGWAEGRLMPPPSRVVGTLWALATTGELTSHVLATLGRVGLGFLCGVVSGTVLAAATGYSRLLRQLVDPTIQALRSIPSLAWVPLFILWFGIFETSKIILISVGVFFPVYLGVLSAVLGVDRKIVEVGQSFRLSGWSLTRRILLPAILPAYLPALRNGLGLGWMFVVAAEVMGASEGLGYLLVDGQQLGKPDQIVAAIVVFALVGKLTDTLLVSAFHPLMRWQDAYEGGR